MTASARYYLYRKINNMPPFVEFNEEQRLIMGDKKSPLNYDFSAFADFAQERLHTKATMTRDTATGPI